MFQLFRPDFEAILSSVQELLLVKAILKKRPTFNSDIMSPYWPSDTSKSKNAGNKGRKA